TCGAVMLITSAAFFAYEYLTFRQLTLRNLEILGKAIAANSTAALAFDNPGDAREVLSALKAQPHVVAARLYLNDGRLMASYPDAAAHATAPSAPGNDGYRFEFGLLRGVQPDSAGGATRTQGQDFGQLTDACNHMLTRIEGDQTRRQSQLSRLALLHRITHATGARHDLPSLFRVVLHNLEEDLPVDFACM